MSSKHSQNIFTVGSSKFVRRTSCRLVASEFKNYATVSNIKYPQKGLGNPNIPLEIAGIEIIFAPNFVAAFRLSNTQLRSRSASFIELLWYTGPTA